MSARTGAGRMLEKALGKIIKPVQDRADEAERLEYDLRHNTKNQHTLNREELDKIKSKVDKLKKGLKKTKKAERTARDQKSIVNRFKTLYKTGKKAVETAIPAGAGKLATAYADANEIVIDLAQVSKDALEDTANNISRIAHTLPKNIENIERLLKEQEEGAESVSQQDVIIKNWTKARKDNRLVEFWKHSQAHRDWVLNHPTKLKYNLINQEARLRGVYPIVLD